MARKVLLTSFQTWLEHQKSNSSDDLLNIISNSQVYNNELDSLFFLRQLPVNIDLAASQVINAIEVIKPDAIICAGMAESRNMLSLESNASLNEDCIYTGLGLNKLVNCLSNTYVSHNAGKFVCEGLYYKVLKYLQDKKYCIPCVFAHVPILNSYNINELEKDFKTIIRQLQCAN